MKRTHLFIVFLLLAGMTVFAQNSDVSLYTQEINRHDVTIFEILDILRAVKDGNYTGIGSFYHNAIQVYIRRWANYQTNQERVALEESARMILRGLASEKHTQSAPQVWQLSEYFNITNQINDGYIMYETIVCLGDIEAKNYASHISILLENFNERVNADFNFKSKIHIVMPGAVTALEKLGEAVGVRPVFFASIGWYDNDRKEIAANALTNLMNGLGEVVGHIIGGIITDPFFGPNVKYAAWQALLRSQAPNETKARVAISAIEASYSFATSSRETINFLRDMRMSSFNVIREMGVQDDSVYPFFERAYREAFETNNTDSEMIILVVRTLTAIRSEEAVSLLTEFLRGLHSRRRSGPWGPVERDNMNLIIPALAATGTQSQATIQLLTLISRSSMYTGAEQNWARSALMQLTGRN